MRAITQVNLTYWLNFVKITWLAIGDMASKLIHAVFAGASSFFNIICGKNTRQGLEIIAINQIGRKKMENTVAEDIANLKANGRIVIEKLGPVLGMTLGYDKQSVRQVHDFIEGLWENDSLKENPPEKQLNMFGAFLGECIATNVGGEWQWLEVEQSFGIAFQAGQHDFIVFPIAKVWKHFRNGSKAGGDGILGFYEVAVEAMGKGKFDRPTVLKASEPDNEAAKASVTEAAKAPITEAAKLPLIGPVLRWPVSMFVAIPPAIIIGGWFPREHAQLGLPLLWGMATVLIWRLLGPRK
ncbi:DUF3806 domain-containing protein [Undibacterium sp. Ji83W]|uniref:DUF3806 domain-containing protein n=1 Tax=Undibacterium sp. Ji83W TaxID=3413043 RepID=UPI003BF09FDA